MASWRKKQVKINKVWMCRMGKWGLHTKQRALAKTWTWECKGMCVGGKLVGWNEVPKGK